MLTEVLSGKIQNCQTLKRKKVRIISKKRMPDGSFSTETKVFYNQTISQTIKKIQKEDEEERERSNSPFRNTFEILKLNRNQVNFNEQKQAKPGRNQGLTLQTDPD